MQVFKRRGFTIIELLVVIAIIGLLSALLLPAVQAARESARRTQCVNNLKQMGLALQNFHGAHQHLPSSRREPIVGTPVRHGWLIYLLPFFEQQSLFDRYDFSVSWAHANNRPVASSRLAVAECASSPNSSRLDSAPEGAWLPIAAISDYGTITNVDSRLVALGLADVDGSGIMPKNAKPCFKQVQDGLSNTLMLTESGGRPQVWRRRSQFGEAPAQKVNGGGWTRPGSDFSLVGSSRDGSIQPGPCPINCTNGEDFGPTFPHPVYGTDGSGQIYSFHPGGVNAVLADGSVRFLSEFTEMRVIAGLVTRAGHEVVEIK